MKTGLGGFGAFFGAAEALVFASVGLSVFDGPGAGPLGIADPSLLWAIDGVCVDQKKLRCGSRVRKSKSGNARVWLAWLEIGVDNPYAATF